MSAPPADDGRPAVAVVDDDTVIRQGLALMVPDVRVSGAYPDVAAFLAAAPPADVVVLDLGLRGTGSGRGVQGVDGVRAVADAGHRVLIYTNERRRAVLVRCLASGATGVIHKAEPMSSLGAAVRHVAAGGVWITPALTGLAEVAERRGAFPTLSPRQRQVLAGRARGETFTSIARRLYITPKTAEEHMAVVTQKFADYLRTHSPADLERHLGLEPPDLDD